MSRYTIRRVDVFSASKFGCLLGVALMLPVGVLLGLAGQALATVLLQWLETWEEFTFSIAGQSLAEIDLLALLKLGNFVEQLRILDTGGLLFLTVVFGTVVLGGILVAFLATWGALVYNILAPISGGLELEFSSTDRKGTIDDAS